MKKGQIIAVVAAVVLTVGLYLASRTPQNTIAITQDQAEAESNTLESTANGNELDRKVEEAVQIIQSGQGSPMQAIGLLREVVQVDSNHIKANYWLGEFSMMSGQFDKAITRFDKLHSLQPDNLEFCIKLAQAYNGAGQYQSGADVLTAFLKNHPDKNVEEQIKPVLEKISVKL